ncbi:hypothetical protein SGRIM128S_03336 [Streptomyces griseomycini]
MQCAGAVGGEASADPVGQGGGGDQDELLVGQRHRGQGAAARPGRGDDQVVATGAQFVEQLIGQAHGDAQPCSPRHQRSERG